MIAYKFLTEGAVGRFSEFRWPVPAGGSPGDWVAPDEKIEACRVGIHACRLHDLPGWIDDELWQIELDGPIEEGASLVIASRGRLVARVETWTSALALEFAEACTLRARDQAFRSLSRNGLTAEAQRVVSALTTEAVQRESVAIAVRAKGEPAQAVAFAADAVSLLDGRRPEMWQRRPEPERPQSPSATAANLGFVVAHAAGREAADDSAAPDAYEHGFASERQWQVEWLRSRLGLPG